LVESGASEPRSLTPCPNPPKSFASVDVLSQNLADDIVAGLKRFNGFPRTINPGDNSALRVRAPRRKGPITTGFLRTSSG
jgi:hypothetical protein